MKTKWIKNGAGAKFIASVAVLGVKFYLATSID
jgi:hypothetical protein